MEIKGQDEGPAQPLGKVAGQATRPAVDYAAFPALTLHNTVGTFSIFMALHLLPDPTPGARRRAAAGNAKGDSTIQQMVRTYCSPVSEKTPMLGIG